jgi:hypothetical protein
MNNTRDHVEVNELRKILALDYKDFMIFIQIILTIY